MKNIKNFLFTEKYRPGHLNDLILPKRVTDKLNKGIYQHLLFYGSAGTGKTSAAKILVEQFKHPYIYINASNETSVDVIRNKITTFCSTRSIMDREGMKVVILDEVDGVSDQFFKALRATMEQFSVNTRFVATCNFINKVPDPVQSRFEMISFDFDKDEETEIMKGYIRRLVDISKKEGMIMEPKAALEMVKRRFPDLRSMLNQLQGYKNEGMTHIGIDDVKKFNSIYKDVFELIINNTDAVKNYQFIVSNYGSRVDDVLAALGNEFPEYIAGQMNSYATLLPKIVITVAKYQSQRFQVIDPVISLLACVYELQNIVNEA